jgi:probable phosphoglycerate mutase
MARAQQTAALVSESVGLPVLVRDGVREISAGDLDLRGDPEAIDRYRGVTFAWAAGQLDIAMPAGDTGRVVLARFDQVIDETEQLTGEPSRAALVISHGAVICTWVGSRARNVDVGFLRDRPLPNAGLAVLAGGSRAGWHAVSWNDVEIPGRPAAAGD